MTPNLSSNIAGRFTPNTETTIAVTFVALGLLSYLSLIWVESNPISLFLGGMALGMLLLGMVLGTHASKKTLHGQALKITKLLHDGDARIEGGSKQVKLRYGYADESIVWVTYTKPCDNLLSFEIDKEVLSEIRKIQAGSLRPSLFGGTH